VLTEKNGDDAEDNTAVAFAGSKNKIYVAADSQ